MICHLNKLQYDYKTETGISSCACAITSLQDKHIFAADIWILNHMPFFLKMQSFFNEILFFNLRALGRGCRVEWPKITGAQVETESLCCVQSHQILDSSHSDPRPVTTFAVLPRENEPRCASRLLQTINV